MTPNQQFIGEMRHSRSAHVMGGFSWDTLLTSLQNAVACRVPLGYEDETGFHFGINRRFCEIPVNRLQDSRERARY